MSSTRIITEKEPKVERKVIQQTVSHQNMIADNEHLDFLDARIRERFYIPREAKRLYMGPTFGGAIYEWVWYETSFD